MWATLGNLGAGPSSQEALVWPQHTFTEQSSHTHCPTKLVSAAPKHLQALTHLCSHYAHHLSATCVHKYDFKAQFKHRLLAQKACCLLPPTWPAAGTENINC